MCKSMNIGFQFQLHSLDDYRILGKILPGGFLEGQPLFWRVDCLSLWHGEMNQGVFSSRQFSAMLQNEMMIDTIRICGFRNREDADSAPLLKTYDEYAASQCIGVIRCVDSYYFNVYVKEREMFEEIFENCRLLDRNGIRIVKEEDDALTSLLAY